VLRQSSYSAARTARRGVSESTIGVWRLGETTRWKRRGLQSGPGVLCIRYKRFASRGGCFVGSQKSCIGGKKPCINNSRRGLVDTASSTSRSIHIADRGERRLDKVVVRVKESGEVISIPYRGKMRRGDREGKFGR
jgi:hypothetical protein